MESRETKETVNLTSPLQEEVKVNADSQSTSKATKLQEALDKRSASVLPVSLEQVVVRLEPTTLFEDLADVYVMELARVTRFMSNDKFEITPKEFEQYMHTLMYLRVAIVNNERKKFSDYRADLRNYYVPAFVHILVTSIGKAVDRTYGFEFVPAFDCPLRTVQVQREDASGMLYTEEIVECDILTPHEMRKISNILSILHLEGFVCVNTGVSMSPLGDLSTMSIFNIKSEILSYKKDSPLYAFYAAFFKHSLLSNVINPDIFRIRYGAANEYASYIRYVL